MTFSTFVWNATEYLCYVSICLIALKEFGFLHRLKRFSTRISGKRGETADGEDGSGDNEDNGEGNNGEGAINNVLNMLGGLIQSLQSPAPRSKATVPASRKRK